MYSVRKYILVTILRIIIKIQYDVFENISITTITFFGCLNSCSFLLSYVFTVYAFVRTLCQGPVRLELEQREYLRSKF